MMDGDSRAGKSSSRPQRRHFEGRGGAISDRICIVIPAFNEAQRLPATIARLCDGLDDAFGRDWSVVVSDDGSSDDTLGVVRRQHDIDPRFVALDAPHNRGKGAALRRGFLAADADLVIFLDADMPVPLTILESMVEAAQRCDLIVGSRRLPGSTMDTPQPRVRRAGGWLFLKTVASMGFDVGTDPQCGVKVLRRPALDAVVAATSIDRFAFDIELLTNATRAGISIAEFPVRWNHVSGSTLHPIRDAIGALVDLARLRRATRSTTR